MQVFTFTATFTGYPDPIVFNEKTQVELDMRVSARLLKDEDFLALLSCLSDLDGLPLGRQERQKAMQWAKTVDSSVDDPTLRVTHELLVFLETHFPDDFYRVFDTYGYLTSELDDKAEQLPDVENSHRFVMNEAEFKQVSRRLKDKLSKLTGIELSHAQSLQVLSETLFSKPFEETKETVLKKPANREQTTEKLSDVKAKKGSAQPSNRPQSSSSGLDLKDKTADEISEIISDSLHKVQNDFLGSSCFDVNYLEVREGRKYWITLPFDAQSQERTILTNMLSSLIGSSLMAQLFEAWGDLGDGVIALPVVFKNESFHLDEELFQNAELFSLSPEPKTIRNEMKIFTRD